MRQGRKRMAWWAGLGLVWTLTAAGKEPASVSSSCDASALEHNLALDRRLGISVVPTIVLPSGRRIPGLIRAPDLMDFLSRER